MIPRLSAVSVFLVTLSLIAVSSFPTFAQQNSSANAVVPALVQFSGVLTNGSGNPLTGITGVTFSLYAEQQGGAPLWLETQNVQPDKYGHYTVSLGSTKSAGLPTDLFVSGEAKWLGIQPQGQQEQPRVLLLSVPYALKAGDAQTVGGLPPSAFVLAAPPSLGSAGSPSSSGNGSANPLAVGGSGQANYIPIWTNSTTLGDSVLYQSGTGSKAKLGINTTKPGSTLDVNGGGTIRGLFSLPASGTASASKGYNSQPVDLAASAFNSGTSKAVAQTFQWQAEPVGNDTKNATGSLNLLFGQGTGKPAETGLSIAGNGQITFANGQTFPGTGDGTITGVTAGTDLTGGGNSGNVTLNVDTTKVVTAVNAGTDLTGGGTGGSLTLNVDTTKVPQLSAANTFTNNQTINGNLTDTGNISATGSITGQTGTFTANNSTQVVNVTQSGTGMAIAASVPSVASNPTPAAIQGTTTSTNALGIGVEGVSPTYAGVGVYGLNNSSLNGAYGQGVWGEFDGSGGGVGVFGYAPNSQSGSYNTGVYGYSGATNGAGVNGFGANNTSGYGVFGATFATYGIGVYGYWNNRSTLGAGSSEVGVWGDSSTEVGVLGTSDSWAGVVGLSDSFEGVGGESTSGTGIYGYSGGAIGIYGQADGQYSNAINGVYYTTSTTGSGFYDVGVWGDSGSSGAIGVVGTTDDGNSLFGKNNTVNHETLYVENDSGFNGGTPVAARFAGPGASTYCYIPRDAADNGSGDIVCTGSKSAAVPVDGNRMVRLYAVEAADNWFEDAGSGQLANGSAAVTLDRVFAQTVNGDLDYHVFLTPNDECEGLYVTNKSSHGFEVHELHHGHSNIEFDYRVMVRRKGFEHVRMQDVTADFAQMKRESDLLAARLEAGKAEEKAHPAVRSAGLPKKAPSTINTAPKLPLLPLSLAKRTK